MPTRVAELTGVSRPSVRRIEDEAPIAPASARPSHVQRHVRLDRRPRHGRVEPKLSLLKRHEVQVLRRAGLSRTKVQAQTGVSERSIRRIE